jgi:signal transduction histidine kinase
MRADVPVATVQRSVTGSGVSGSGVSGSGVSGSAVSGSGEAPGSSADSSDWVGGARRWDAYYLAILAVTLLIEMVEGPPEIRGRLLAGAALVAIVPWYVVMGRPVLFGDADQARRGTLYLAGLIGLLAIAESFSITSTFILLALCPQCFMTVPFRRAVAAVVMLSITPVGAALLQREPAAAVWTTAGIAVLDIAFSVAFGSWVRGIIERSQERAELIGQLEATRTELARAHREAGTLAERQRLAVEIHDTIAQGFGSIVMLVQAAEAAMGSDLAAARRHLALAGTTARENLAEARAMVAGLAPAVLAGGGIDDALRRLAEQIAAELDITSELQVSGTARELDTGSQVVLLRVCQEALTNVRKHAGASRAQITLSYGEDLVRLAVCDDGAGFDPARVGGGFGLRGMRGRVTEAGGRLQVRSEPGAGTTVSVEVPA